MPLTKTELLYISLSLAAGAAIGANWSRIRTILSPLSKDLSQGCNDAYQEISEIFSSKISEVFQSDKSSTNTPNTTPDSNTTSSHRSPPKSSHRYGGYPSHFIHERIHSPSYFPRHRNNADFRMI